MEKRNYASFQAVVPTAINSPYGQLRSNLLEFVPTNMPAGVPGSLRDTGMKIRGILALRSATRMYAGPASVLQEVVDFAPAAMVAYGPTGEILLWNQEMVELTGYTKFEMEASCLREGKSTMEILYPEPREYQRVMDHLRMIETGERQEYEGVLFTLTRKDGEKRAIYWTSRSRTGGGTIRVGIDATSKRIDRTTGVLSKAALEEDFEALFPVGNRRQNRVDTTPPVHSLVLIDLDFLKYFNDRYGHDIGNVYINAFVCYMEEKMRSGDLLYRWGGDEFVIIAQYSDAEQLRVRYETIVREIATTPLYIAKVGGKFTRNLEEARSWGDYVDLSSLAADGLLPGVGMSVGISDFEAKAGVEPKKEMDRTFKNADRLMYYAKSTKRHAIEERVFVSTNLVYPQDFTPGTPEKR